MLMYMNVVSVTVTVLVIFSAKLDIKYLTANMLEEPNYEPLRGDVFPFICISSLPRLLQLLLLGCVFYP